MGGSAFSSLPDPPYTPRMPPKVYRQVLSDCHAALRELFVCVATPIEGPEKKDFGDIDILVALERRVVFPVTRGDSVPRTPHELIAVVQHTLFAKHAIVHGSSANLAIPWPLDMDDESTNSGEAAGVDRSKTKYIQVDINICPDVDQLCWTLYKHAHGDLWNLLGSTIRPFGLTVDEEALWLRIPEIETFDRKKAKVCLTRDPVEILHFLGMKVEGFWSEPFGSVETLFEYATTCRLFHIRDTADGSVEDDTNAAGVLGGEEGRKKLKSNDRRRMKGRPVYRRWINEFIPRLRDSGEFVRRGPGASIEEARAMVRDQAFAMFFVEAGYKRRLREWQLGKDEEQVKSLLKELIPSTMEPQLRSCLLSAMRKIVIQSDTSYGFVPSGLRNGDGFYDAEVVRTFVQDNSERVGRLAWAEQLQKAQEAMRLKALKRRAEEVTNGQLDRDVN